ncbi:MAG: hypothetical protein CVU60_17910 [Deltaproteobacteria bacterium HGW-Deltaproteobacteria-18]|nr:MAG: hypothetical protein CVU60_17910 [Deltaproteobacteria bacterium HGW-Deltaproteobacteria-18]
MVAADFVIVAFKMRTLGKAQTVLINRTANDPGRRQRIIRLQSRHGDRGKTPRVETIQLLRTANHVTGIILILTNAAAASSASFGPSRRLHFFFTQRSQKFLHVQNSTVRHDHVGRLSFAQIREVKDNLAAAFEFKNYIAAIHLHFGLVKGGLKNNVLTGNRVNDDGLSGFWGLYVLPGILSFSHGVLHLRFM